MEGDFKGVRIVPGNLEFCDVKANKLQKINITVKNIDKHSREIRCHAPQSKNFTLKVKNPEIAVAPGLEVQAILEYCVSEPFEERDRFIVTVDGEVVEVPVVAGPSKAILELQGPVSFGNVVAKSKVISREIPLFNHGSKSGEFKIKYSGDKPIAVVPSSGSVPPKSVQVIKVEYVTRDPEPFDEMAKVMLEGQETFLLRIFGEVVEGSLELLAYQTETPLRCVTFGCTYYGTDKTESAILFNNSPEPVCFVAVLDEDAIGQELGVDLTKSTSTKLAERGLRPSDGGEINDLTSLVTAIPNQGMLGPYEKIPLFFRFSPRWTTAKEGFKTTEEPPPRKDFSVFMQLQIIGASKGFDTNKQSARHKSSSVLEVALTGTALPVLISVSPESQYQFGDCSVGDRRDAFCTIHNECNTLPVSYQLRRIAHFLAKPAHGRIQPEHSQDVVLSFSPNQIGTFQSVQYVDVIGPVADSHNPFIMHQRVIHSVALQVHGKADPGVVTKQPVYNPGITPKITNEVGLYADTTVAGAQKEPRNALHNSQFSKLHHLKSYNKNQANQTLLSFPNDRAASVRPSNRHEKYQSVFTRTDRHTYVDPDYAYTDEEAQAVASHKDHYKEFVDKLRDQRETRERSKEYMLASTALDIGIKPAAGLHPKKLRVQDALDNQKGSTPPNAHFKLLSQRELAKVERMSSRQVRDGLNAEPTTNKEKVDCQKILSPQELHQVIIGPPLVDFGKVCLRSTSQRNISIINNLDTHIHVVVQVDCRELRQTSPLSQVVPPKSKALLPLIFESSTKGKFQRSLDYSINGFYRNHVTVLAEVVRVSLELSAEELELEPALGLPAEAGVRGVVSLRNPLNHSAEFTWSPILGDRGTAFSIRPATGFVDALADLDCEVVFHPSFMAPEEGLFALQVHGGSTLKLKCKANLGAANVSFIDRRIMFGQVPMHLNTTRTATLKNNGLSHAYFQVLDPNPFSGLTVSPLHGVVPVGGVAELRVDLAPSAVIKFDTRIQIAIRGWKTLELRMGGTVEPPNVDISVKSFNFGGVYCGSSSSVPFALINKSNTEARMEFDLSRYSDFTLNFPTKSTTEDYTFSLMNPGVFSVTMEPQEVVKGELVFKPTEIAAYDFVIPAIINQMGAPTPAPTPTPFPPTPAPSSTSAPSTQHIIPPRPVHVEIVTPRRKVVATALRQPLQLSTQHLEFTLSPAMHELAKNSGYGHSKGTVLVNNSDKPLKWTFDLRNCNQALEEGNFKFLHASGMPFLSHGDGGVEGTLDPGQTTTVNVLFCPLKPGKYESSVPVILNDDQANPYVHFSMSGELQSASLWFDPLAIVLTPVPLETEVQQEFHILAQHYTKSALLEAHTVEVECEDGSKVAPLTVTFPQGNEIKACAGEDGQPAPFILSCKISFKCEKPISFTRDVRFLDDQGNSFKLSVTATADNCLLTCYPFIAQHRSDHQIVVEHGAVLKGRRTASQESDTMGEAVLRRCASPPRPSSRPSTTATSSNFEVSSSSYEDSSASVSGESYPSTPRDGALNKFPSESEPQSRDRRDLASRSLGSALFPEEDSEEGVFYTEVMLAVQRWFTSQGWPGGPHPIHIPHSLRSSLTKKPREPKTRDAKGNVSEANNLKKEFKTVYDMVNHLCGRHIPGIPINNPLPDDPIDRVKQIHWQHATLLTFLKTQGGCVSSVKPEYLMEPEDYKLWRQYQMAVQSRKSESTGSKTEEEEMMEEQLFEAVSKRAWTDICLQLLKTLVLSKITPRQLKNLPLPYKNLTMPMVDPDPLCSNVYCLGERIMLLWLNFHYEQQRTVIWQGNTRGPTPASRWIVNFDFDLLDGLVLASIIGAHAPFVVKTYLRDMYTQPSTAEQCLHNALKVTSALRYIGIDYDIQAIDITDPNPIALMLLVMHLYNNLPQYIPKSSVEFTGTLHEKVKRQVKLSNPSPRPLTYTALLAGHDARDFTLPRGDTLTLAAKSSQNLTVEFTSRYLRPAQAVLVLVGRRQGSSVGSTLVFNLTTQVDNLSSKETVRYTSPCYELRYIPVDVLNPFTQSGDFRIHLLESSDQLLSAHGINTSTNTILNKPKKKKDKQIRSRIDCGQKKSSPPPNEEDQLEELQGLSACAEDREEDEGLSAFSTTVRSVYLEPGQPSVIEVRFLPFQGGRRQCSVLFVNEEIGEFIYTLEATVTMPNPQVVPHAPGGGAQDTARISSAAAAGTGMGAFGGDDSVIYWRCECGQTLRESLHVPVVNKAREQALVLAAQQLMPETEARRREVTGTLHTGSVMAHAYSTLARETNGKVTKKKSTKGASFKVEVDCDLFVAPSAIYIPDPAKRSQSAPVGSRPNTAQSSQTRSDIAPDGTVELPIEFSAKKPGHYSCKIVLRAQDDVRVYQIECTVIPEGNEAHIEFSVALHQPLNQNIPIVNQTDHDWPMVARIEGVGFAGPPTLLAKSYQTCPYPLMFRPQFEGPVLGKLVLTNTMDGVDHTFHLHGNGEKPHALDHIIVSTEAKQTVTRVLNVPNITRKKLYYRVESDLDFVTGAESITILPGKTGQYEMHIKPLQRGQFKGVISFHAAPNPVKEVDSDGDELPDMDETDEQLRYRVWYSLDVHVSPPPPLGILSMRCSCQKKAVLEIGLNNPLEAPISLDVTIQPNNTGLSGADTVTLPPSGRGVYQLTFAPAVIGHCRGSVIFFHPAVGEFWYDLSLTAETPAPTDLFSMECELGRWVQQTITLNNPTDETLLLVPTISNSNNFALERDSERPVELHAHSSVRIPLTFMPSTLGEGDHQAKISFHCQQLGEWVYNVTGVGRLPQPQDPVSITAATGSNSTLIIPFRNPLDTPVICDVTLQDKELEAAEVLDSEEKPVTPFCLLLKHSMAVRLGPKTTLDIPLSFAPEEMKKYEGEVTVKVRQESGDPWMYDLSEESEHVPATGRSTVHELTWRYPVVGYPEQVSGGSSSGMEAAPALVACQARDRVDERLEVTLSGVAPSAAGPKRPGGGGGITARARTPADQSPKVPDGVVVGESLAVAEEFTFEIQYGNSDTETALEPTLALQLVRKHRDKNTGLVTLIFNIVYAPYTTMAYDVHLVVKGATGGLWRFPLRFVATEPEPDDEIVIEATGLGKESSVGFRLNSHTRHPVPYNAYFVAGSDREFAVAPQNGELMPAGTRGSLIKVDFLPTKYGKIYQGKLVVQTTDMQWTYSVRGTLPDYSPPRGLSSQPMSGPHPDPRTRSGARTNYIRDNLRLTTTGVSSPIKGAPLLTKRQQPVS